MLINCSPLKCLGLHQSAHGSQLPPQDAVFLPGRETSEEEVPLGGTSSSVSPPGNTDFIADIADCLICISRADCQA